MNLSKQEKLDRVKNLRPIDDVFFEVLAQNKEVCQEILQTILQDTQLIVKEVTIQSTEANLYGRGVRLDALCVLGSGQYCNIEVQRSNNDNHLKRARYNASMITVRESNTGEKFENVKDIYLIYISEFDFLNEGKTIYHVDKVLRETGTIVDDGLHEIFVNTAVNDGTDIADLMACFTKKEFDDQKFPKFTAEVKRLKETEGGAQAVCEVMEIYKREAVQEREIELIQKMLSKGYSKEEILELGFTEDEYSEAQKSLLVIN